MDWLIRLLESLGRSEAGQQIAGGVANKAGQIGQGVLDAMTAPGNALRGEYDQVGVSPDGSVTMTDPRMYDDATALAGRTRKKGLRR